MLLSKAASAAAVLAIGEWQTYRLPVMEEESRQAAMLVDANRTIA
ncbi:MAG: hypothetical protein QOJ42_4757 [Acidobacteriaceae bacterium]|jgi:hypothetical protein|nr:hypothetical protein [Acidobacteriaceae bacterium]